MTDIELPTSDRPSRINRGTVSSFDPDDPSTVDEKIFDFRSGHPEGTFKTEITESLGEPGATRWTVRASVWCTWGAGRPADVTAHATRTDGVGDEITAAYALETAESVALGRALRYLGYGGHGDS